MSRGLFILDVSKVTDAEIANVKSIEDFPQGIAAIRDNFLKDTPELFEDISPYTRILTFKNEVPDEEKLLKDYMLDSSVWELSDRDINIGFFTLEFTNIKNGKQISIDIPYDDFEKQYVNIQEDNFCIFKYQQIASWTDEDELYKEICEVYNAETGRKIEDLGFYNLTPSMISTLSANPLFTKWDFYANGEPTSFIFQTITD